LALAVRHVERVFADLPNLVWIDVMSGNVIDAIVVPEQASNEHGTPQVPVSQE